MVETWIRVFVSSLADYVLQVGLKRRSDRILITFAAFKDRTGGDR